MKRFLAIALILCMALPVLAKKHQSEEIITPVSKLERRSYQTRTYNQIDQAKVLKSILNVLQDEGYIVNNANSLLGFVYAVKDFDLSDPNIDISKEFGFTKSRLNYNGVKVATLETSANVTQYGEDVIRVRINFKRKLLNQYGNAQFIDDVSEQETYEDFYTKLDTALDLHKQADEKDMQTEELSQETVLTPELEKEIHEEIEKLLNSTKSDIPTVLIKNDTTSEITPQVEEKEVSNTKSEDKEQIANPEQTIEQEVIEENNQNKEIIENTDKSEGTDQTQNTDSENIIKNENTDVTNSEIMPEHVLPSVKGKKSKKKVLKEMSKEKYLIENIPSADIQENDVITVPEVEIQ